MKAIQRICVPGTFDPPTLGHLDVIKRAKRICADVCVAVASSYTKNNAGTAFSLSERLNLMTQALQESNLLDVAVFPVEGLLVDFCTEHEIQAVVKGLRATTDFEYELAQAGINHSLAPHIESIYVMSNPSITYISSSAVREIACLGGDISAFVPNCVEKALYERFTSK